MSVLISGPGIHLHPYLLYYICRHAGGASKASLDTHAILRTKILRAGSYGFMTLVAKIEDISFFMDVRAFTHVFLAIFRLRNAWPNSFIKHTLIRFRRNFPKFTKLYDIDHWPFENV